MERQEPETTIAAAGTTLEEMRGTGKREPKSELLDILEDEEQERERTQQRRFVLPQRKKGFTQTLAGILKASKMYRAPTEIRGNDLARNIAVCYCVDSLSTNEINRYLARWNKFTIPRLVLADLAAGIIPETAATIGGIYDPQLHFEAFAVRVAGDLYHHFFSTLATPFYVEKRAVKGAKGTRAQDAAEKKKGANKKEDAGDEEVRFFRSVRGERVQLTLAAGILEPYLSPFKERIAGNEDTQQLKELIAAEAYRSILRNDAIRDELATMIADPQQNTRDIFIYSVLSLHRDFFKVIEENGIANGIANGTHETRNEK